MHHVMSVRAYERKAELGGGFRGSVYLVATKETIQSPILTTFAEAKYWAQNEAHNRMGGKHYSRAYVRKPRNSYAANIWAPEPLAPQPLFGLASVGGVR